jgi:hypothetical protein
MARVAANARRRREAPSPSDGTPALWRGGGGRRGQRRGGGVEAFHLGLGRQDRGRRGRRRRQGAPIVLEKGDDLRRRRRPIARGDGEQRAHQLGVAIRDDDVARECRARRGGVRHHHGERRVTHEGRRAGDQLPGDHTEPIEIGTRIVGDARERELRRDVAGRADDHAVARQRHPIGGVLARADERSLGEAEVEDLGAVDAGPGQHDVGRLEVTVDEAEAVHGVEAVRDGEQAGARLVLVEAALLEALPQRRSVDQLHGEKRRTVVIDTEVEDRHHVGIVEPGERRRLALEAQQLRAVGRPPALAEELERHLPPEALLLGDPHAPHAAATERSDEAEPLGDEPTFHAGNVAQPCVARPGAAGPGPLAPRRPPALSSRRAPSALGRFHASIPRSSARVLVCSASAWHAAARRPGACRRRARVREPGGRHQQPPRRRPAGPRCGRRGPAAAAQALRRHASARADPPLGR